MALVSGGRSNLNPYALPFIPAALRLVEDFSPEWWGLVNTHKWFREHWVSQHEREDDDDDTEDDVAELLPEDIDIGVDEDILSMEAQFEEFLKSSESESVKKVAGEISENGSNDALVKPLSMPKEKTL